MSPRIDQFLRPLLRKAGFKLDYEIAEGESVNPDFENPEVVVRFAGADVDLVVSERFSSPSTRNSRTTCNCACFSHRFLAILFV